MIPILLRRARKAAKLTQETLAGRIGVTLGTVTRWETGVVDPPSSQLVRAVEACGFDLALEPRVPPTEGCVHRLQTVYDETGDRECSDCGLVIRSSDGGRMGSGSGSGSGSGGTCGAGSGRCE